MELQRLALKSQYKLQFDPVNDLNGDSITGIESIIFVDRGDSYNYSVLGQKRLYVVGQGPLSSPGHPSGHQIERKQTMVMMSYVNRKSIHVFHEQPDYTIRYLGFYIINNISRKISPAGWVYTEMELTKL
jgi:hypothetical protein